MKSPLLSARAKLIDRKKQKNQEKLEEIEIAASQNCDSEIISDCNKPPHSSFPQSTHTHMSLGSPFFKYGVAFSQVTDEKTKSNCFPLIVDCHRVRIHQQQVITGQLTDAYPCVKPFRSEAELSPAPF